MLELYLFLLARIAIFAMLIFNSNNYENKDILNFSCYSSIHGALPLFAKAITCWKSIFS